MYNFFLVFSFRRPAVLFGASLRDPGTTAYYNIWYEYQLRYYFVKLLALGAQPRPFLQTVERLSLKKEKKIHNTRT